MKQVCCLSLAAGFAKRSVARLKHFVRESPDIVCDMVVVINDSVVNVECPRSWINYGPDTVPPTRVDLKSDRPLCRTGDVHIYLTDDNLRTLKIKARCTCQGKLLSVESNGLAVIDYHNHFTRLRVNSISWLNNIPKSHRLHRACSYSNPFDLFPLTDTLRDNPDKLMVFADWLEGQGSHDAQFIREFLDALNGRFGIL